MTPEPSSLPFWEHLDDRQRELVLRARDKATRPVCFRCGARMSVAESVAYEVAEGSVSGLPPGTPVLLCPTCDDAVDPVGNPPTATESDRRAVHDAARSFLSQFLPTLQTPGGRLSADELGILWEPLYDDAAVIIGGGTQAVSLLVSALIDEVGFERAGEILRKIVEQAGAAHEEADPE